jgi:hypothetical protein
LPVSFSRIRKMQCEARKLVMLVPVTLTLARSWP